MGCFWTWGLASVWGSEGECILTRCLTLCSQVAAVPALSPEGAETPAPLCQPALAVWALVTCPPGSHFPAKGKPLPPETLVCPGLLVCSPLPHEKCWSPDPEHDPLPGMPRTELSHPPHAGDFIPLRGTAIPTTHLVWGGLWVSPPESLPLLGSIPTEVCSPGC